MLGRFMLIIVLAITWGSLVARLLEPDHHALSLLLCFLGGFLIPMLVRPQPKTLVKLNVTEIDKTDLRIDIFKSKAVKITHLPTGISVESADEDSEEKNKEKALELLLEKLRGLK